MAGLRVLLTNGALSTRTGTEVNVRDVALGLLARGHAPIVYSPELGEIADELRSATVPVVDDLAGVGVPPDVIHGHHHPETMTALLQFPGVPAIYFSHDFLAWHDAPPEFPRILRYVAVDDTNRDRLASEQRIPAGRIRVILNAVDLARFAPRPALPPKPGRALLFSNYASEHTHTRAVREACGRAGVALDVVGAGAGASCRAPEDILGRYDLVFAKGRCALEALAVGTAVVLVDYAGAGPLVTAADLERLRRLNFGRRLLRGPLDPERIAHEIARYDAADAGAVSRRIRATAGLDAQLDELIGLYRDVVAENAACPSDPAAEERAAAAYLRRWGPRVRDAAEARERLERACRDASEEGVRLRTELEDAQARLARIEAEREGAQARLVRIEAERDRLQRDVVYVRQTATWRLRDVLLRSRALVAAYRIVTRVAARVPRRSTVGAKGV